MYVESRRLGYAFSLLFICLFILLPAACKSPEPVLDYSRPLGPGEKALVKIHPEDYPDFEAGYQRLAPLLQSVKRSLDYMSKPSSTRHFPVEGITHDRAKQSLEAFKKTLLMCSSAKAFAGEVQRKFDVYMSTGCDQQGTVLFTGYCEPIIPCSLEKTGRFKVPLYRLPDDLVKDADGLTLGRRTASGKLVSYYTRKEIDEGGVLKGRGLELAWVEHPLDAYIVHVQGSATLTLPDGSSMKIGYAGKNGRPYRSLGQALIADGRIAADRVSLESIRNYFRANRNELLQYLYKNESYIFFTENEGGPFGSIGVEVTPYCTIATDKSVFPRAAVAFIDTSLPTRSLRGSVNFKPYNGFALDQDTGGAIRSAGRVDVFIGTGDEAEYLAGRTRNEGRLYYLFVK